MMKSVILTLSLGFILAIAGCSQDQPAASSDTAGGTSGEGGKGGQAAPLSPSPEMAPAAAGQNPEAQLGSKAGG
jgi:hypothetical protein